MSDLNYFREILGVSKDSSVADIKKAYRQQAKQWHPDRFHHDRDKHKIAEEKIKDINLAYEFLIKYENGKNTVSFSTKNAAEVQTQKADPISFYNQAVAIAQSGEYEKSLDLFARAIRLNPYYLEALEYRYMILTKLGFENRAATDRNRIAEIKNKASQNETKKETTSSKNKPSGEPEEYYYLGVYQIKQKKFEKSIASFSLAIHLKPDYLEALEKRQQVFEYLGLKEKALEDYYEILKLQNIREKQAKEDRDVASKTATNALANQTQTNNRESLIKLVKHFKLQQSSISGMIIDHQRRLISIGDKKTIHVFQLGAYRSLGNLNYHTDTIHSIDFHPSRHLILTGGDDRTVKVFDLDNKQIVVTLKNRLLGQSLPKVKGVYFLPEDNCSLIIGEDNTIKKWDFHKDNIVYSKENSSPIVLHSMSHNHKYVALLDVQNILRFRDSSTGSIIRSIKFENSVVSIEFSKQNNLLAVALQNQTIQIWDLNHKTIVQEFKGHFEKISFMKFIEDKECLITIGWDGFIKIWSLQKSKEIAVLSTNRKTITTCSLIDKGKTLITGTKTGEVFIYRLNIDFSAKE